MADFKLSMEIVANAKKAQQDIKKTKIEFQLLGKTLKLDKERMKKSFMVITGAAAGMFAAIAKASPSMRVAFKQMEISAFLASLALGEALAPALEETLVPAMQSASEWIVGLDSDMQMMIGTSLMLVIAIGVIAGAIAILGIEFGIIILAIALVVGAFFGLKEMYDKNVLGMKTVVDAFANTLGPMLEDLWRMLKMVWKELKYVAYILGAVLIVAVVALGVVLFAIILVIMIVVAAVWLILKVFNFLVDIIIWLVKQIINLVKWFANMGEHIEDAKKIIKLIPPAFKAAWVKVKRQLSDWWHSFLEIFKKGKDDIIDVFKNVGEAIKEAFNTIFIWIGDKIDWIIEKIKDLAGPLADAIDALGDIGGAITGGISTIGGMFQEGGTVPQTGLIFAHRKEEVLRPVEARQWRRAKAFGMGAGGGATYNYNSTYIIKAVNPRAIAKEIDAIQKRQANRRMNI